LAVGVEAQALLGDVNSDGTVTITDALLIARYSAGLSVSITVSRSDVNCDGAVNISDALRLARYNAGLIPTLVCINPTPVPTGNYVPGDVIVGFYDTVTLEQADNLIDAYNLSWEPHFPTSWGVWLEVQVTPEEPLSLLTASPIISWAEVRGYSGEIGKTYILAQTKINVTQEAITDLVNGIAGLKIVEYVGSPRYGLVKVPAGTETSWINTFSAQPIVKYAQLNSIVVMY
jgi:hypothetical protein